MLSADFPAQIHKSISNTWLNGGASPSSDASYGTDSLGRAYVDCTMLPDGAGDVRRFRPRGIVIGSDKDTNDPSELNCHMWDENDADVDVHYMPLGVMHPFAVRRIYRESTTARDIKVYG
jgi:hypothetical protein